MSDNWQPFGTRQDTFNSGVGFSQIFQGISAAQTLEEVSKIRALLEQEVNKGNARAKELAALMDKHACPVCVRGKGSQRTTGTCGRCLSRNGKFLESESVTSEELIRRVKTGQIAHQTSVRSSGGYMVQACKVEGLMRIAKSVGNMEDLAIANDPKPLPSAPVAPSVANPLPPSQSIVTPMMSSMAIEVIIDGIATSVTKQELFRLVSNLATENIFGFTICSPIDEKYIVDTIAKNHE